MEDRLKEKEFLGCLDGSCRPKFFFDGASESNPGAVGAGGLIMDQHGNHIASFEWGLEQMTNNKAEAYALMQGLQLIKKLKIKNVMVFEDSSNFIQLMLNSSTSPNIDLNRLIISNRNLVQDIGDLSFYHILRANNKKADSLASSACSKPIGQILSQGITLLTYIP